MEEHKEHEEGVPRIMIVDDNADDRELATRALKRAFPGMVSLPVADLASLSARLDANDFDAVVTDYQLKWTTGLDILRAVRQRRPDCVVIMFTSTGTQEVAVEAMKEGLDDYVIKAPSHFVRLPVALQNALHRARARADARAALTVRERFLVVASHELRTPLTTILGSLSGAITRVRRLAAYVPEAELVPVIAALDRAMRQSRRLDRLQEHIAMAVSLDPDSTAPEIAAIDLVPVLREAISSRQEFSPGRVVTLAAPPHLPLVTDAAWVDQVVTSLVENALKFSEQSQPVQVRARQEAEVIRVEVLDRGPGISESEQHRIWDRFYRQPALSHISGSSVGLGLGLSICRTLVERLGGMTGVESRPGSGSTFWFTLPLNVEQHDTNTADG